MVSFTAKAFESSAEYGNHRAAPVIRWSGARSRERVEKREREID